MVELDELIDSSSFCLIKIQNIELAHQLKQAEKTFH